MAFASPLEPGELPCYDWHVNSNNMTQILKPYAYLGGLGGGGGDDGGGLQVKA